MHTSSDEFNPYTNLMCSSYARHVLSADAHAWTWGDVDAQTEGEAGRQGGGRGENAESQAAVRKSGSQACGRANLLHCVSRVSRIALAHT